MLQVSFAEFFLGCYSIICVVFFIVLFGYCCTTYESEHFEAELGQLLHLIGVYHITEQPAGSTLFKFPVMRDP